MSVAEHRAALKALLLAVPSIGRVYDYERYVREESKFRDLFLFEPAEGDDCAGLTDKHVRGWWLRNTAISERELGVGRLHDEYVWQIRGYLSLHDEMATELVMEELVEGIRAAYRSDASLGGLNTAESPNTDEFGIQKLDAGPVLFCGVLCHSVTLQLRTQEYV